MPKYYPSISEDLQEWALEQPLFFTASAPLTGAHINISPKGYTSSALAVLGPNKVAYLDATGSGCETVSHLYENGRITLMFCSFGKSPRIMRWFSTGRVVERGQSEWEEWRGKFRGEKEGGIIGARAVIVLDVWKVQTSCGFGVPLVNSSDVGEKQEPVPEVKASDPKDPEKAASPDARFIERPTMASWASKMIEKQALPSYQAQNNSRSQDGLPGLRTARGDRERLMFVTDARSKLRTAVMMKEGLVLGILLGLALAFLLVKAGVLQV